MKIYVVVGVFMDSIREYKYFQSKDMAEKYAKELQDSNEYGRRFHVNSYEVIPEK